MNEAIESDQLKKHQEEQERLLKESNEISRRNAQDAHSAREQQILDSAGIDYALGISAQTAKALAAIPRMSKESVALRDEISQDYFAKFVATIAENPVVIKPSKFWLLLSFVGIWMVSKFIFISAESIGHLVAIIWFVLFVKKINKIETAEIPDLINGKPILAKGFVIQKLFYFFPVSVYIFITQDSFCIQRRIWGVSDKPIEIHFKYVNFSEIAKFKKGEIEVQVDDGVFKTFRFAFYSNKKWIDFFEALTMYHSSYQLFGGETKGDYPIWGGEPKRIKLMGFVNYNLRIDGSRSFYFIDERISALGTEFFNVIRAKNL
jgi:hypothetical protein